MIIQKNEFIYLETKHTSYVMQTMKNGILRHVYYGNKISQDDLSYYQVFEERGFSPLVIVDGKRFSMDTVAQEYPTQGRGDYRQPACVIEGADGRRVNGLTYVSAKVLDGRVTLEHMPHLDTDVQKVQTLAVTMKDEVTGAVVTLYYTVFEEEDVISRYVRFENPTEQALSLRSAMSISIDFERADFEFLSLQGSWVRERHVSRRAMSQGMTSVESRRGSSSHQMNPSGALVTPRTGEDEGEAYGFSFVYSGDFKLQAEVTQFDDTRLQLGLNPETFSWKLEPGESFMTPEALLTYSSQGLNGMSQNFHQVCRRHLGKCADKTVKHPIIINSWEAMYFQMSDEKIEKFINDCNGLGIDTFVLDDGWFGHRDDDTTSLGDWIVDENKFKNGLHHVAECCKKNDMRFGIWFEPEMISRKSRLYEAHPDWCIRHPGVEPIESRHQLILDMGREEVVDEIYRQMAAIIEEYDISYIKWDMNRNMTDRGSHMLPPDRQGEHGHRYILGVYALMERLVQNYPNVFFEGCSGGGGRYDFGILYYMPQIWTSDDSDAVERMKIQYGTSMIYPPSTMVGHVSACPNHQTGRTVSFATRGETAQMCNYGYELNVGLLPEEEKEMIKEQIVRHKKLESLVKSGTFYRLRSPFEGNVCAWEMVSEDGGQAYVYVGYPYMEPNPKSGYLKVKGLRADATYLVEQLGVSVSGATLMHAGLPIRMPFGDHMVLAFDLKLMSE